MERRLQMKFELEDVFEKIGWRQVDLVGIKAHFFEYGNDSRERIYYKWLEKPIIFEILCIEPDVKYLRFSFRLNGKIISKKYLCYNIQTLEKDVIQFFEDNKRDISSFLYKEFPIKEPCG